MFLRIMYESGLIAWTIIVAMAFLFFSISIGMTCLKNFSSTTTHLFNASFIFRHLCLSHLPLIFNSSFFLLLLPLSYDHKTKASFPTRSNKLFSTFAFFFLLFFHVCLCLCVCPFSFMFFRTNHRVRG